MKVTRIGIVGFSYYRYIGVLVTRVLIIRVRATMTRSHHKPRRHKYQFSLGALFVLTLIAAIVAAILAAISRLDATLAWGLLALAAIDGVLALAAWLVVDDETPDQEQPGNSTR